MNRSFHVLAPIAAIPALLACAALGAEPSGAASKPAVAATGAASPQVTVQLKSRHSAIELAGSELCRYLGLMAGNSEAAAVVENPAKASPTIALGLMADFGLPMQGIRDAGRDDAVYADVQNSRGVIAGSNPRSVLFATYRFLEACGCRWVRPGKDGDYVPTRSVDKLTVRFSDRAAYRFRGGNNCGCFSLDQILDRIAWAPKVGQNMFFSEFFLPRVCYNNHHDRRYPSRLPKEPRSDEEIRACHELTIREIKRRGMLYHAIGHGWTSVVLGLPESESDHGARPALPPGKEWMLAMVKGKRELKGPTITNLCYSNPKVQQILVQCVADYAEHHPEVDYLHVWHADSVNNTCECDRCRTARVSDWYVVSLNAIDAELSRRRITTKIVFANYTAMLWAPEKERFANPARFVMMYAPISRRYDSPYYVGSEQVELPPYQLNNYQQPSDERARTGLLRGWQRVFQGDAFVFDYHMTWNHYFDPGYYGFTAVMAEDIRRLPKLGMDGFVSCQVPKAFFPHGYPTYLHAWLLWNPQADTDTLAREYFAGVFGDGGEEARQYMTTLWDVFSPFYASRLKSPSGKDQDAKQAALAKLARVPQVVADFRPVIARHASVGDAVRRQSWKYLSLHADIVVKLAEVVQTRAAGRQKEAQAVSKDLLDYLADHESELDPVLDRHWFTMALGLGKFAEFTPPARPAGTRQ